MALKGVTDQFAHRKREMPMCASVLKRNHFARFRSVKNDRLSEKNSAEGLSPNLVGRCSDVPVIPEEHGELPNFAQPRNYSARA
jgi:hypothetical protein